MSRQDLRRAVEFDTKNLWFEEAEIADGFGLGAEAAAEVLRGTGGCYGGFLENPIDEVL